MSFKSFFKHLGHAIEHAAKDVVHGVENIAKDAVHAGEAAVHMVDDVAHGRFKAALNDAVHVAQCGVKAFTELPKTEIAAICDATSEMHLNKSLDKIAQKVKGFENKAVDFERNVANKMVQDVANGVEGTVNGAINTAKDIGHGDFRKACGDFMGAAGSAVQVACDLTPEGLAANAAVGAMQAGHIGSEAVQGFVGDIVGGPKGLLKRAAESGAGLAAGAAANEIAKKVGPVPGAGVGGDTLLAAGVAAPLAVDAFSRRHGHRSGGADGNHDTGGSRGVANTDAGKRTDRDADKNAGKRKDKDSDGSDRVGAGIEIAANAAVLGAGSRAGSGAGSGGGGTAAAASAAAGTIAAAQASAHITIAAQDAIARIQNQIALNQAKNQIDDELGKGAKALAQ